MPQYADAQNRRGGTSSSSERHQNRISNTRGGRSDNSGSRKSVGRPVGGFNRQESSRNGGLQQNLRPGNSGVNRNPGTRPSGGNNGYRPGSGNHGGNHNGGSNVRPGGGSNGNHKPGIGHGNNNGNHNGGNQGHRPGGGNHGGNHGGGHNGGNHGYRPGHDRPGYGDHHHHPARPGYGYRPGPNRPAYMRPPVRPGRPPMHRPWTRPVPPPHWRPYYTGSLLGDILGLTFGVALNTALDNLYYGGYTIDGYMNNEVYLSGVNQFNYYWPDAILVFNNGGLVRSQFYNPTIGYNVTRYYDMYAMLCRTYGNPAMQNMAGTTLSATWFGGGGDYITLQYTPMTSGSYNYFTVLTVGR